MAATLQFRRYTTSALGSLTPAEGELFVDLDKDVVVVGDGSTAGGFALQSELVSGTNIKTVNGNSLLGSGDVDLSTSLALSGTDLVYTNIDGTDQTISLAGFLDDTTNTVASAALDGNTITFTREDATTFTLDVTNLYDDTNLVTSVGGSTGDVTLTGGTNVSVDGTIVSVPTANIWNAFTYSTGISNVEGTLSVNLDAFSIEALNDVNAMTPSDGQVLSWDDANSRWDAATPASGGISNVVEDTTPQLGGDLDAQGNDINNILALNGTSNLHMYVYPGAAKDLFLGNGETTNQVTINGTTIKLHNITYPSSDGTSGQVLTTNGSGALSFTTVSSGIALTDLSITTAAAGTAALEYNNTSGVFTYTPPDLSGYFDSNADVWNAFTFSTGISNVEGTVTVNLDAFSIEALNDVNTMTPSDGQVLTWDDANSRWDAATPAGGSVDLSEYVGAVGITGNFTLNGDAFFNSSVVEKGSTAIFANEGSAYIDCLNGNVFFIYLSSNSVQYFSNTPATGDSYTCTVIVNQETGSNTLTWFGGIQWAGGTAPSLSTGRDIFVLSYVSGTWYGAKVAEDVSAGG